MQRFLIKSLVLILPIAMLLGGVEYMLRGLPYRRNSYTKKMALLDRNGADSVVLIVGTSRELYGINPDWFDVKTLNMAHIIQSLYYDAEIVSRCLDRMPKLELILWPISDFSCELDPSLGPHAWRIFYYQKVYGIPPSSFRQRWAPQNRSVVAYYGLSKALWHWFLGDQVIERDFSPEPTGWAHPGFDNLVNDLEAEARVKCLGTFTDRRHINENMDCVRKTLKVCKERGVAIVFVTMPVSAAYRKAMHADQYQTMQKCVRDVCHEFGAKYFNYCADKRFADLDFRDCDHLNVRGAEKLSRILNSEIIQPMYGNPGR